MDLASRLKEAIRKHVPEEKRYKDLADMTKVGASSWRQFFDGKQRPTMQMIESICQRWPQHALWIASGITDADNGHIAATDVDVFEEQQESRADEEFFQGYVKLIPTDGPLELHRLAVMVYLEKNPSAHPKTKSPKKATKTSDLVKEDSDLRTKQVAVLSHLKQVRLETKKK